MVGVGLALINKFSYQMVAMFAGGMIALFWQRRHETSYSKLLYPIVSGLLAGAGFAGIIEAILQISGVNISPIEWPGVPHY